MDYEKIVRDIIKEYVTTPIDVLGIGDAQGEYDYLTMLEQSYIRTVRDVDNLCRNERTGKRILEIGSFLGPVSIALKRMGYAVSALDIPEFYASASLRSKYEKAGIPFVGVNLRHATLPYDAEFFDAVIMCEVIEHLNFNPLPVLKEINRVVAIGGLLYIGMPNQSSIINRIKLVSGKSIYNPIEDFSRQLDRNRNMIVGVHWREYTMEETESLIGQMGFDTVLKYYFTLKGNRRRKGLLILVWDVLSLYPPFRQFQVVVGKKVGNPAHDFWSTEANA
jgi:2-polyprenyl-3-methyl-5-hydroxy-6-metoxy-1,4-benzoquinol methylase